MQVVMVKLHQRHHHRAVLLPLRGLHLGMDLTCPLLGCEGVKVLPHVT